MTATLPAEYGRVLGVDERAPRHGYIADRFITDAGLTAIALPIGGRERLPALGISIANAVLRGGEVLGRRCTAISSDVVVLATTEYSATVYRGAFTGNARVTVARIRPWDGTDPRYWEELRRLTAPAGLVLIDRVQGLASGSLLNGHVSALSAFIPPLVGLYSGNETKAGIGGDLGWSEATGRFWYETKTGLMHALDSDDEPWPVILPRLDAAADAPPFSLTAHQVKELGRLGRSVDKRGGPSAIVSKLFAERWDDVCRVCNIADPSLAGVREHVTAHMLAWEDGLRSNPYAVELPDEPPF